jgi:hypothetical protein
LLALLGLGLLWLAAIAWSSVRSPRADPTPVATTPLPAPIIQPAGSASPIPSPPLDPDVFRQIPEVIDQQPLPERALTDFDRLWSVTYPVRDYFATAEELGRYELGEPILPDLPSQVGEWAYFNTSDGRRQAELVFADELAAYWVEIGLAVDRPALAAAAERLRTRYYSLLSRNFSPDWPPNPDGPLFDVLHVIGAPGTAELGYFTDENQYPRSVFARSNERKMVYLNMAELQVGTPLYDGTLVHEIQHLMQWHLDANEEKWFNEGLSQVSETMAGLDTVDPRAYLGQSYIRLDRWDDSPAAIYAHYAGSYLYLLYLWEQLGDDALVELVRHPANGLAAVRSVLDGHRAGLSLESFTADWATALYLDGRTADPRFNLRALELPQPFFSDRARQLPYQRATSLEQYTVDYIDLDFQGRATISFAGDTVAPLLDQPADGEFWLAPAANSSRSQLTAAVDLSGVFAPALSFEIWHDLEPDYDFAYLTISTDGGRSWSVLELESSVNGEFGPAWGGRSAGWVRESIALDDYAGSEVGDVLLRFEVLTDFREVGRGFAVRDLSFSPAAGLEWQPEGFVSTGAALPQRWEVRLVHDDSEAAVTPLVLDELNRGQVEVELGLQGGTLIVVPLTPFVETAADYWLSVER